MICPAKASRSTIAADSRGSAKGLGPAGERLVGGDRDGRTLPLRQDLKQQFGATTVEFHVSELVDLCRHRDYAEAAGWSVRHVGAFQSGPARWGRHSRSPVERLSRGTVPQTEAWRWDRRDA